MNKTKPSKHYKDNNHTIKLLYDHRINHIKKMKKRVKNTRKLRQNGGKISDELNKRRNKAYDERAKIKRRIGKKKKMCACVFARALSIRVTLPGRQ